MDITTVNDRHLYEGRVVLRDPENPAAQVEMARRIVRFGPPGWLTVVEDLSADADIALYPTSEVVSVSRLREVVPRGTTAAAEA
jgi:hypothetical protein